MNQANQTSRTRLGLKNSKVALLFYVTEMLVNFVSRTIFIQYLGADVLGLNTTATNLLNFLNLAELGISTAVAFTLYKPLAQNDTLTVTEIISVQGWLYKRIALIVFVGAIVLMCFFPIFFAKMELPLWYAYASFGVLLYSALLTYLYNYKQVALSANQQEYKIIYSYKSVIILKSVCQIFAVAFLAHGYIWWIALQGVFSTIATISLSRMVKRTFPYLSQASTKVSRELRHKYAIIITKVKQLFFHKVAGYVLVQTSPLIIYAFVDLEMVAVYGNYMMIVNGLMMLTVAFFNGVAAGVGNLIATGDRQRTLAVFKEIFTSRFLVVSTFSFAVFTLGNSFVTLWVGSEYLFDRTTLLCLVGIMYIHLFRSVVEHFLQGFGMFADIWAPIVEAVLNISLSILLGYYFGITGILCGVLISLVIIICIWKPIYLFRWGLKESVWTYIRLYLLHIAVFGATAAALYALLPYILVEPTNFFWWGVNALTVTLLFVMIEGGLLWLLTPEMKAFVSRIVALLPIKRLAR